MALIALLCVLVCSPAAFARSAAQRKTRAGVDATVSFGVVGRPVPNSFIGLSMETSDLAR